MLPPANDALPAVCPAWPEQGEVGYATRVRFHVNVGNVDGLTRGLGGVPLVLGALLALPRVGGHTLETAMLWLALLMGLTALAAAFAGHCSWFAGIFVSGAVWMLFVLRNVPVAPVQIGASALGITIGLYALYTRATRKCAVNYLFRITQPHGGASGSRGT